MSKEYQKTIDDLQAEIEVKAKELQKESEKFDALVVNKLALNKRMDTLNTDILARKQIIDKLDNQIEAKQEEIDKKNRKGKATSADISADLELLTSLLAQSKVERESIEGLESKADIWKAKADVAQTAYAKTLQKLMKASNALKLTRKSIQFEKDELAEGLEVLKNGRSKLKKDSENFNAVKKMYAFYAKRHLRLYRKEGRAVPQNLIDLIENLK